MKRLLPLILLLLCAGEASAQPYSAQIQSALRNYPWSYPSDPVTCDSVVAHSIYYNTASNVLKYCNGTSWLTISDSSAAGAIISGTTPITGGADTQVGFNDGGFAAFGDAGLTYNKTTDMLTSGGLTVPSTGAGVPATFAVPKLSTTGVDNIVIGTAAGGTIASGAGNTLIGSNVGDSISSQSNNTLVGFNAGTGSAIGGRNTGLGALALTGTNNAAAVSNTGVGYSAGSAVSSGTDNTCIGDSSCSVITTGSANTHVGSATSASSSALNYTIALGYNSQVTASNQMVVGGNGTSVTDIYWSEGVTNASTLAATHNGTGGSGTDNAGGAFQIAGGKGTGAGIGGAVVFLTAPPSTTGTALNSLATRQYLYAGRKALTAGAATNTVRIAVAQGSVAGGVFSYCARASDATDYLTRCGDIPWTAVNKGGTETCTMGTPRDICSDTVTPGTCAVSTLTAAFTCVSNAADTVDIQINSAAAITETTLDAGWSLLMNYGSGAVTPQ